MSSGYDSLVERPNAIRDNYSNDGSVVDYEDQDYESFVDKSNLMSDEHQLGEQLMSISQEDAKKRKMVWIRNISLFAFLATCAVLVTQKTMVAENASTYGPKSITIDADLADDTISDYFEKSNDDDDDDDDDDGSSQSTKPNIIFMLADDLGYQSLGYNDDTDMDFASPFMTKIGNKGIILSNYYAQEACTPSRASFLTGRYPLSLGMQFNEVAPNTAWAMNDTEITLAEVLKSHGYSTYMLGKWNLGHFHPKYLPSARGFDYFMGFMCGESYYWSKKSPQYPRFTDLLYGDANCYYGYDGEDKHNYSTYLYRDKALDVIDNHNFAKPLFMYLAFQAVHDPFYDDRIYTSGIPSGYLSDEVHTKIMKGVVGRKRRQYAMALNVMDSAVESIHDALDDQGVLDNTYMIFASDNGGCYQAGGKNGPLRGSKGSLFEGGVKVDAFVYSKLIASESRGATYGGMMHVSDWFPTILDMASITYASPSDKPLDGYSQYDYMLDAYLYENDDDGAGRSSGPRSYMLYNYYINVENKGFNMYVNGPVAIRNQQYKLIHSFSDNTLSEWYSFDERLDDDSAIGVSSTCSQSESLAGNFTFFLFDLWNDPYETTNLYDDDSYTSVQKKLYAKLTTYFEYSQEDYEPSQTSSACYDAWKECGDFICPWVKSSDINDEVEHPSYCTSESLISPQDERTDDKLNDIKPTNKPTHKPSPHPTYSPDHTDAPSHKPSYAPTEKPNWKSPSPTYKPSHYTHTKKPTHRSNDDDDDDDEDSNTSPTPSPTTAPTTASPSVDRTSAPTPFALNPDSYSPTTFSPTSDPTKKPSKSVAPTETPSTSSTETPTKKPSEVSSPPTPTFYLPSSTSIPTYFTSLPTKSSSTSIPTTPSVISFTPSLSTPSPTKKPSATATKAPTAIPTTDLTHVPTKKPRESTNAPNQLVDEVDSPYPTPGAIDVDVVVVVTPPSANPTKKPKSQPTPQPTSAPTTPVQVVDVVDESISSAPTAHGQGGFSFAPTCSSAETAAGSSAPTKKPRS